MVRVKAMVLVSVPVVFCALSAGVLLNGAAAQTPEENPQVQEQVLEAQDPRAGAAAAPLPKDVYAVKFVCGTYTGAPAGTHPTEGPVKPGNYLTAINVHNPNGFSITFWKKAVLLYRADKFIEPELPMPPYPLRQVMLKPDWGLEIDCADIRSVLLKEAGPGLPSAPPAPTFIKGWVVIEVKGQQAHQVEPLPLDVTAVYTSHGYAKTSSGTVPEGFAEDVEPVLPKRVKG